VEYPQKKNLDKLATVKVEYGFLSLPCWFTVLTVIYIHTFSRKLLHKCFLFILA